MDRFKGGGNLGGIRLAATDHRDLCPGLDEMTRDRFADAASGSGDDGDLVLKNALLLAHVDWNGLCLPATQGCGYQSWLSEARCLGNAFLQNALRYRG